MCIRVRINTQVGVAVQTNTQHLQTRKNSLPQDNDERRFIDFRLSQTALNETLSFYDQDVLNGLGWRDNFLYQTVNTDFLNAVIPAPSKTINLAQALIVLSLATKENRCAIVKKLTEPQFASLRRFLGANGDGAEVLGFQNKLVDALR